MRYSVDGHDIRSENAAKPASQASQYLREWLTARTPVSTAVDYGCGRLRYAREVAAMCQRLFLVDSTVQLDRLQVIDRKAVSVRAEAKRLWPKCTVQSIEEFAAARGRHDFILCANVLSAIPSPNARKALLEAVRLHLGRKGLALFVTQYRNSYFKQTAASGRAVPFDLGWLLQSPRGWFYYGLITPFTLTNLVRDAGLAIENVWKHDGSAYALCSRGV